MSSFVGLSAGADFFNKLGYVPFVGTVSGASRIAYGVVKASFSALAAVFSLIATRSTKQFGDHFKDGLLHTGRGLIELTPFIGGAITYSYDKKILENIICKVFNSRIPNFC